MTTPDAERRAARRVVALASRHPSVATGAPAALCGPRTLLMAGGPGSARLLALLETHAAQAGSGRAQGAPLHGAAAPPLHVVAVVGMQDCADWPALRDLLRSAGDASSPQAWPEVLLPGLEPLPALTGGLALTLAVGDPSSLLRRLAGPFDVLWLADDAPLATGEPGRWQTGTLARLAASPATLIVDHAPADTGFEAALRRSGFRRQPVEAGQALHEPDGTWIATREGLRPRDDGHPTGGRPVPTPRQALVIGAGLAGAALAAALAARAWSVTVLERQGGPAREGSGQPLVVDHLHLSPDDNPTARLTRAGARLAAVRGWVGDVARPLGKLILPADATERAAQAAMLGRLALPPQWARMVDADEARALTGLRAPLGGLWLARARTADPVRQCADWLARPGITLLPDAEVAALARRNGAWCAIGTTTVAPLGAGAARGDGPVLASAPVAIVAAATRSPALAATPSVVLERLAGQTTMLAGGPLAALRSALGGAAYACPVGDGQVLVGSTFSDADLFAPDAEGDADNVARIAGALGLDASALMRSVVSRHGGVRCATRDRLPAIGPMPDEAAIGARVAELSANDRLPLPRQAGLYGAFGMGARGLLWSVLAAEVLAAHLDGEPPPLEQDLLDAIDPARFARAALRRGRYGA